MRIGDERSEYGEQKDPRFRRDAARQLGSTSPEDLLDISAPDDSATDDEPGPWSCDAGHDADTDDGP